MNSLLTPLLCGTCLVLTACSSGATPQKMSQIHPGMSANQVHALLGQPARIEQTESSDQTVTGEVDYYHGSAGEGRVVLINQAVHAASFEPGAKP